MSLSRIYVPVTKDNSESLLFFELIRLDFYFYRFYQGCGHTLYSQIMIHVTIYYV